MSQHQSRNSEVNHVPVSHTLRHGCPQDSIAGAYVVQDHGAEVASRAPLGHDSVTSINSSRKMQSKAQHLIFVYRSGALWLLALSVSAKRLRLLGRGTIADSQKAGIGSTRTAVTPCNWPAWPARET